MPTDPKGGCPICFGSGLLWAGRMGSPPKGYRGNPHAVIKCWKCDGTGRALSDA